VFWLSCRDADFTGVVSQNAVSRGFQAHISGLSITVTMGWPGTFTTVPPMPVSELSRHSTPRQAYIISVCSRSTEYQESERFCRGFCFVASPRSTKPSATSCNFSKWIFAQPLCGPSLSLPPTTADRFMAYLAGVLGQIADEGYDAVSDNKSSLKLFSNGPRAADRAHAIRSVVLSKVLPAPARAGIASSFSRVQRAAQQAVGRVQARNRTADTSTRRRSSRGPDICSGHSFRRSTRRS
jgi:hypothetical protein